MNSIKTWAVGTPCPEPAYPDFSDALNQASHHYADDSGKEWGQADECMKRAVMIAIGASWPYWALKRMYGEARPLPTFDSFMGVYCRHLLARAKGGAQ